MSQRERQIEERGVEVCCGKWGELCVCVCVCGGGGGEGGGWWYKDMKTREQRAEEVVKSHHKRISPLLAKVDLECWMLLWASSKRESCKNTTNSKSHTQTSTILFISPNQSFHSFLS